MNKSRNRPQKPAYLATSSRNAEASSPTNPPPTKFGPWAPVLLVVAIGLTYSNSFHGPLLFDDVPSITENPSIRSLWPLDKVLYPTWNGGSTAAGRPLVNLSLAVNYAISELEVWSYHVFNLLVHILTALVLWGLVRRTLLLPRFDGRFDASASGLALAVALVWGVHPLATESVTYIIQRAESMVALFYLLVLYGVVRGETSPRAMLWRAWAVACCALGMATKEVMVTAPVVVAMYLRAYVFDSWKQTLAERGKLLVALAATWLLLAALMVPLAGRGGTVGWDDATSSWDYAMTQCRAIVTYLKLSISPQPLVFDYGTPLDYTPSEYLPYAAVVASLLVATVVAWLRWPAAGFLAAAFWIILSPTSSVVPILTQTIAEHRVYLPLTCIVALVVVGGWRLWQRTVRRLDPETRERGLVAVAPVALVTLMTLLLGAQTWLRNIDYGSALRIWHDTTEKMPYNPRGWSQLASQFMLMGDVEAALTAATRSIELNPDSAIAWFNRGTYRLQAGRFREAIDDFDRSLQIQEQAKTYQNRGAARRRLGEYQPAIDDFTRAIELDPMLHVSYRSRALAWAALGRHEEARRDARAYLQRGGEMDESVRSILNAEDD